MTTPAYRPNVLVTLQRPLLQELSTPEARLKVGEIAGDIAFNDSETAWSQDDMIPRLRDVHAIVASWGSCLYDERVLDAAPNLQIVCYAAGSIRHVTAPAVFERGVKVTHAAQVIAESVAEHTLTVVLLLLRRVHEFDAVIRAGGWRETLGAHGRELYGKCHGIVGASMVGRSLIPLLRPFGVRILVFDPFLSSDQARELGVEKSDLPELMRNSDVISLHAPILSETENMISREMVRSIKDDAVFVNNARSWLVDMDALLEELQKERFDAALDVFDEEPLPPESPFRRLKRTILTPHAAGHTVESRSRLVGAMVDELERFIQNRPLLYDVTPARLKSMH